MYRCVELDRRCFPDCWITVGIVGTGGTGMKELAAGDGAGEGAAVGGTTPGLVPYPIDMEA